MFLSVCIPLITWSAFNMAASRLMQSVRVLPTVRHGVLRYRSSTSSSQTKEKVLQYLMKNVSAVQTAMKWNHEFKYWRLKKRNEHFFLTEALYGINAAAAYYTLEMGGGVRFKGHAKWFRPSQRGPYNWDFLKHKDDPVECLDLSGSITTYMGLSNIERLHELRELNLSRCHYIDDWTISRLHIFKDSLEVLSLVGCRQVTERGLSTLHHLQNLKHLDVSDLPAVSNKGLVLILLEAMLPACKIVGNENTDGLRPEEIQEAGAEHVK